MLEEEAAVYFKGLLADLERQKKGPWVAEESGRLAGMVQLAYELRAKGRHQITRFFNTLL